jgi:uncharacterized protein (DUF488 family)
MKPTSIKNLIEESSVDVMVDLHRFARSSRPAQMDSNVTISTYTRRFSVTFENLVQLHNSDGGAQIRAQSRHIELNRY